MASLRAHLFVQMVKLGVKARIGRAPTVASIRDVFNQKGFPPPAEVAYRAGTLGGVSGEWVSAGGDGSERPRLLYLHGGGFVACSALMYRPITGSFARAGFRVFAPDYRLAPEHPFPAGLDDVVAAWAALSAGGPAGIGGDSAGGNLALVAMIEARRRGLPLPAAACLFSPTTDMLGRSPSLRGNIGRDPMFTPEILACLPPAYLAGTDPADPRVSPIEADLAGLPPLLIHAGERELLRDDSVRLAERAEAAGVPVALTLWPVVPHAWQLAESFLPEARRSLAQAADFLREALDGRRAEARSGALA